MKKITFLFTFLLLISFHHYSYSQSGTIDFNTADNTNLGAIANDGEGGSSDIAGVVFDIFISNSSGVATGGNIFYDTSGGDFEGLSATGSPGVTGFEGLVLKTSDGSEFHFNGFASAEYGFVGTTFKVEGFKNASSTGSTTLALSAFGTATYGSGDFSDAIFQDVDEVRITSNGGGNLFVVFDEFVIAPATVADTTTPAFENSTPSSSLITQTGFTLATDINEAGTIYYVVVADGASVPTSTQVKAGTGSGGSGQITSGNAVVSTGSFTNNFSVTGLSAGSTYDIYVVAEDDEGSPNLQISPTLLENITTVSTLTWDGSNGIAWNTANNWTPASVPSTDTDVVIPSGLTNYPTAFGAVTVNTVTMASGTSLLAQSTFAGNITYNRTLATNNWYLISAPVVNQDIDAFVATEVLASGDGDNLGFAPYVNDGTNWSYYQSGASGTGNFLEAKGYSVKLASSGDIAFTGSMLTDNATIAITSNTNGFNLVGNPYPSYIAANNTANATNNILKINDTDNDFLTESTLWFWNESTDDYDERNHATGAFHIAPGQGFFVSSNGANTFSITENMQSHQTSNYFQKTATNPSIQLYITDGITTKDTDIFYIDGTTTDFDNGYDSSIFGGVSHSFQVYTETVSNNIGRKLGIQSLPNSNLESMIIPVGINAGEGKEIIFSLNAKGFPADLKIFLEDKNTNTFTRLDELNSNYKTTLTESLNGIGRFYLHTKNSVLNLDENLSQNISIYKLDTSTLRITGLQRENASLKIYTTLGKEVFSTSFKSNGIEDIPLSNLASGIYIVQLQTDLGIVNKKIILE